MNIILTTSEYISRLKSLIAERISNLVNPNGSGLILAKEKMSVFTKEMALHMLLDQGKSFQEAELIIATMEEWGLPLEHVAILDFEIHGNSVWIKPD